MTIAILYDILLIALLVICVVVAARRGFVGTLVHFIGYFAALIGAWLLSRPLAQWIYEKLIDPSVQQGLTEKFEEAGGDLILGTQQFFSSLPQGVSNALALAGITGDSAAGVLDFSGADVAVQVSHSIIMPAVVAILGSILFLVLFSVLLFVVRHFVRVSRLIGRIPLVGGINRFLGAVLGVVEGCIAAYLAVCVIHLLSIWLGDSVSILSPQVLSQAPIFHWLSSVRLL